MNFPLSTDGGNAPDFGAVRTVSEVRRWLATLAQNGVSEVQIQEPFRQVGNGQVIVQASLMREDGARVNLAVYCYDDTPPDVVDWLPPILGGFGGDWFQGGESFR